MTKKMKPAVLGAVVVVIGIIIVIIAAVSSNGSKKSKENDTDKNGNKILSAEDIDKNLKNNAEKVTVTRNYAPKGTVSFDDTYAAEELPDIDNTYPVGVEPYGKDIVVEIFSSPEKAGTGTDGWMTEMAEEFNSSNAEVNGKSVGIRLRSISSGTQIDYIAAGVYTPDAISPSANIWCSILSDKGIKTQTITDRTVGNAAGILIDPTTYSSLESEYGTVDIKAIVDATANGTITTGYTNPFVSTTGLNFLAAMLTSFDESNPLSADAVKGFQSFQDNVPFVAYNTLQMRTAAESGTFDCMMMEYQSYSQMHSRMPNSPRPYHRQMNKNLECE